jgi:ankyrin repeat protein
MAPPSAVDEVVAEFRRACFARDPGSLRQLLRRHPAARAHINAPVFPFDSPALVHFAGSGDVALIDVLLEFGADPNRRSEWWAGGFHPLHVATGQVADRLIAADAVPDACAAANLDRPDLLREILAADPSGVQERGGDGQTPLHFARSREVADLLLQRGADIDARDIDHRSTPAQWMLDRRRDAGRYELARHLVASGASADVFLAAALGLTDQLDSILAGDRSLLELRTGQGAYGEQPPSSFHIYFWTIGTNLSPFQVATQFEQTGALDVLLRYAEPRQRLVSACASAGEAEAKRLLREHPHLPEELTPADHRALADAAWAANTAAVQLMLEVGFDPAVPGHDGGSALHCAAWEGSVPCVQALLRHPRGRALVAHPDATYGATPLGWCCHGAQHCGNPAADHVTVARLLLEAGARPGPDCEQAPAAIQAVIRAHPPAEV